MRNYKKRIQCVFLIIAIMLTICLPICAEESVDPVTQTIVDHLEYMLPQFASSENIPLGTVSLGEPLSVYRTTSTGLEGLDHRIHPIISDQNIVALANVIGDSANAVETTLYIDFANALQQYVVANSNEPFAIIYAKEGIFALNASTSLTLLKEVASSNPYSIGNISPDELNVTRDTITTVCQLEIGPIPRVHLNVDLVDNGSTDCCNGLCWAASIAMIKNYYDGTQYDAYDIHDMYGCVGRLDTESQQIYGFLLAMEGLGMIDHTLSYSHLTYPILYNYISNDQLLFTHLMEENRTTAHAVVGYGYQYNTTTAYFQFMDPNTGHNSKAFPLSTGPVTFQLSGYTYTVDYYIAVVW